MSEKKIPVTAQIGIEDKTGGTITTIKARLKSITAPVREMRESFHGVTEAVRGVGEHLEDILKPIGAITAAFTIGGIVESAKSFIEAGAGVADTATKLGVSAKSLAEWQYAASQSGVSSDDLTSAVGRLNRNLVDVASGKNKELPRLLTRLGISVRDSSGHIKTADQLLPELADGFTKLHTPLANNALAIAAFGKGGPAMIQLMKEGSEGFNKMAAEGRDLGKVMNDVDYAIAKESDDAIGRLGAAFVGLKNTIGSAVMPELLPLIDAFKDLIKENKDAIASGIGSFVKSFADELKAADWKGIWADVRDLIGGFKSVIEATIGWKGAIIGLVGMMNAGLIISVANLGKEIYGLTAKMAIVFGAPVVAMVVNFVTAIRAGYGVMESFNLICAANPVGLLVVGIAAAVAAIAGLAYVIIKNWEPLKAWFGQLMGGIGEQFSGLLEIIDGILEFDGSKIVGGIKKLGQGIYDSWAALLVPLKDVYQSTVGWIIDSLSSDQAAVAGHGRETRSDSTSIVGRGRAGGFAPMPRISPQALAMAGGGAPAGPTGGQVGVTVDFKNMPQGVQAQATTSGPSIGRVDVGKSRQPAL